MSSEYLPVVAAIPNYNMANSLNTLLSHVIEQGYDGVYVLDDASTDHSQAVATAFGQDVHFVAGRENVGPGANRNRIIEALSNEAIIHFVDADVRLITDHNPEAIRASFKEHPSAGAIGGLIQLPDGTPWMFNYGPRYSIFSIVGGWSQAIVSDLSKDHPKASRLLDRATDWRHRGFPNVSQTPQQKEVFWAGEANLCVSSQLFEKVGGFDPNLRYHEVQDLAIKFNKQDRSIFFDPSIVVEHPDIKLDDVRRKALQSKAGQQIIRKYGLHLK